MSKPEKQQDSNKAHREIVQINHYCPNCKQNYYEPFSVAVDENGDYNEQALSYAIKARKSHKCTECENTRGIHKAFS
ncbi:hypothetical protein ACFL29_01365 [Patescibacteria group bacterium]